MSRQFRFIFAGAVYHVVSRGFEKSRIFARDRDKERFLLILGKAVKR